MAVDMFIKIGKVPGESLDDSHKGAIDVLSWSWGASQSGAGPLGSGATAGKVHIQDLTLTKYLDKATPLLFGLCCNGNHIDEAVLTVRKAGAAGKTLDYLKITFNQVIVSAVSSGASGGQDRITENVTLHFAKVKMEYTPQSEKGTGEPSVVAGWDISANKAIG